MNEELPAWKFDWEKSEPRHIAGGFRLVGGTVTILLGYAVYDEGVLLHAAVKVADQNPDLWRRYWVPREEAVDSARELADHAEYYMFNVLDQRPRHVEDLDFVDFIEHLQARINGGLH